MTDKITNEDCAKINAEDDPEFRALVERFDPKCWARYDLSAMRLGWHFGREQMIERFKEDMEARRCANDIRALRENDDAR